MSDRSRIEWTDATWNPVTGCTKVSAGCKNCYAERMIDKRGAIGSVIHGPGPREDLALPFFHVLTHPDRLDIPLRWRKPRRVFVCSMGDLFHDDVPDGFIERVFAAMALATRHTFQVLTKRPARMLDWSTSVFGARTRACRIGEAACDTFGLQESHPGDLDDWPQWPLPNVWLGTSVENQQAADERIPLLLQTPAAVRFVSCEPLLGPVDLTRVDFPGLNLAPNFKFDSLRGGGCNTDTPWRLDWVICGGESGPKARPMHPDWARSLRDQCELYGVPFLFKQWGEWCPSPYGDWEEKNRHWFDSPEPHGTNVWRVGKKTAGRLLNGRLHDAMPPAAPKGQL